MSFQHSILYNNPANFVISPGASVAADARCTLGPITEAYSKTGANFAGFDATKSEIIGGVFRQKNTIPAGATCGASYKGASGNGGTDLSFGNDVLTRTIISGAPSIVANYYVFNVGDAVSYVGNNNISQTNQGCRKFKIKPLYTNKPASGQLSLIDNQQSSVSLNSLIYLIHDSATGKIFLTCRTAVGAAFINGLDLGVFVAVAGQSYELELNWYWADANPANNYIYLMINGNIQGSQVGGIAQQAAVMTRGISYLSSPASGLGIGYSDIVCFSTPQHTAPYTPGYTLYDYKYVADNATIPIQNYSYLNPSLGVPTIVSANAPHYTVNGWYWNGLAWAASANTFATSMTAVDWVTNFATFPAGQIGTGITVAIFTDNSNVNQMGNTSTSLTINEQVYSISNPNIIEATQFLADAITLFSESSTLVGADLVKYVFNINGVDKWYNSGTPAWENSSGYAQSNTPAEITAQLVSLSALINLGAAIKIKAYLHSASGLTTPILTSNTINYSFFAGPETPIPTCIVWGYTVDSAGIHVGNVSVSAQLLESVKLLDSVIGKGTTTVTSNAIGYFEIVLPQGITYDFKFVSPSGSSLLKDAGLIIPSTLTANYDTLI
jgi:hypothetical protein